MNEAAALDTWLYVAMLRLAAIPVARVGELRQNRHASETVLALLIVFFVVTLVPAVLAWIV